MSCTRPLPKEVPQDVADAWSTAPPDEVSAPLGQFAFTEGARMARAAVPDIERTDKGYSY